VTLRIGLLAGTVALVLSGAASDFASIQRKLDDIDAERLRPGARVQLTPAELAAYAEHEMPDGVRSPKLQLADGTVTGSAMVDFGKVRRAQGHEPGWLMARLIDGERPVSVTARVRSANGQATVEVQRVSIGTVEIDGPTLDFLIQNVLLPMYPDAVVGQPFELGHNVERLEVRPTGVNVWIGH
jgi:hypothetical protein